MSHSVDRRSFLQRCALTSAGAAIGWTDPHILTGTAFNGTGSTGTGKALAIGPIVRNKLPKFKFSLAAYSYRSLLKGKQPALTLFDFIDDCARMGLEGTELTSYYFPTPPTSAYLHQLRQRCFRLGLDVSGTAVGNNFGVASATELRNQIDDVKQWIEHAATLGAPVIRIFAGHAPDGADGHQTHTQMIAAIEECCEYAGRHGVFLALENHGGPTSTARGLLALVHDVQSPWFGVNLDTGNFHSDDIYGDLALIAPYALNVQVKITISGPSKKAKPTNFGRLANLLRDTDYRGYVVLEYEEKEDPRQACPKYIDQLREAFA
ncbi:MAG: sugar phosphate isomerase/epimerase family protein [Pirellulales bacterium]